MPVVKGIPMVHEREGRFAVTTGAVAPSGRPGAAFSATFFVLPAPSP
jgi:hypothetical protein